MTLDTKLRQLEDLLFNQLLNTLIFLKQLIDYRASLSKKYLPQLTEDVILINNSTNLKHQKT